MMLLIVRLSISRAVWISLLLVTASAPSMGQQPEAPGSVGAQIRNLGWKTGPSEGKIAGRATIVVPAKYVFLVPWRSRYVEVSHPDAQSAAH
jgi:hypothetical protein